MAMDFSMPMRFIDRHHKAINPRDTVTLCIGGQIFVTRRATLYRLPNSRLYMLANQEADDEPICQDGHIHPPAVYFFDRDPQIFRFVLDFYRTGELHLPANICGPFVHKELIFWGIDESLIQPCCMPAYMQYEEERRTKLTLFKDCFEDIDSMKSLVKYCRGFKRWRYTMWLFLDYPSSSLWAKIWATILLLLMIGSVMCFCLSTHDVFRSPSSKVKLPTNNSRFCSESDIQRNPKIRRDCTTEPRKELVYVDIVLNIIFTMEYLSKLILSPDKKKFLKAFVSVLDMVILSAYWMYISLYYYYYYHYETHDVDEATFHLWILNNLALTQSLRILRIFKISKISRGLRVLMLTIKKSITELILLAFLLMNGIFCFSSLIYIAEYQMTDTFPNIPISFWWSIVTLTTVGYGDMSPKGAWGYLVGSLTAICGCIVTGLAIPIIGNNFNTYYKYMQNQLNQDTYLKELRKDLDNPEGFSDASGAPANRKFLKIHGKNRTEAAMASIFKTAARGVLSENNSIPVTRAKIGSSESEIRKNSPFPDGGGPITNDAYHSSSLNTMPCAKSFSMQSFSNPAVITMDANNVTSTDVTTSISQPTQPDNIVEIMPPDDSMPLCVNSSLLRNGDSQDSCDMKHDEESAILIDIPIQVESPSKLSRDGIAKKSAPFLNNLTSLLEDSRESVKYKALNCHDCSAERSASLTSGSTNSGSLHEAGAPIQGDYV